MRERRTALLRAIVPLVLSLATPARAQAPATGPGPVGAALSGRVTNRAGEPIPEVAVRVLETARRANTGEDGRYVLAHLPPATYRITFSRLGFLPAEQTVVVQAEGTTLDVVLSEAPLELAPIRVVPPSQPSRLLSVAQPLEVLADSDVHLADAPNLGSAVASAAGARVMGTGSGIGKPVIRGLRSDRVVVAADGFRVETQQWEDDEGPTVPTADADRIEVIRGPASVLYGSDALGGIVNVVSRALPTARRRSPFLEGRFNGSFGTNGHAGEARLGLEGARQGLGFRAGFQLRNQGNLDTPDGELGNSGSHSVVGKCAAGARGGWGSLETMYSHYSDRNEINPDPASAFARPLSRSDDDLARLAFTRVLRAARLDVALGAEENRRREYADRNDPVDSVANGKLDRRVSAEARLQPAVPGSPQGILGVSGSFDRFTRFGADKQAPDSRQMDLGSFLLGQIETGRWHWLAGARIDHRALDIEADPSLGVAVQARRYDAFTGTAGVLVRLSEPVALAFNLGRGFRAPSITELFTQGTDEGTQTVLHGNPRLSAEHSLEADLGLRVQSTSSRSDLDLYWNSVRDFIYPRRSGALDPTTHLPIVGFVQGNALLRGVELSSELDLGRHWQIRSVADYVRGDNISTHAPLPWIPPLRLTTEVRWLSAAQGPLRDPYVEAGVEADEKQTRLDPNDIATPGYVIARLEAGGGLPVAGHVATLELQITNLFDRRYASFLDIHKGYALAPGRNVVLRLSTPLGKAR